MSQEAAPTLPAETPGDEPPTGLVTLIVGDVGRGSGGARSRRPAPVPGAQAAASSPAGAAQWSCQWTGAGPGPVSAGCEGEADLTLSLSTNDAVLVKEGHLPPSVAFMQGRLKTSGNNALLLRVLAWSATPAFSATLSSWSAEQS